MAVQIQLRRDTAANWTGTNPVLAVGEPGVETDTLKVKVGDGATAWNSLAYTISTEFTELNGLPTTLAGYGITDGGGDVTGSSTTTFTNKSGNISQWTNDSSYLTSIPAQSFSSLTGKPTTVAGYGITDALALGTSSTTALAGDTALLALGTSSTTALAGDSVLTDLGISDGSSGQVLTTDGSGGFTFATAAAYATSTQGTTADSAIQPNTSPTLTNLTLTGYLAGPATFTIDPAAVGDNTGKVVIAGDLQVDGVQTTINSTTVAIDDLNFSIATDAADSAAANGAGITIGGAGSIFAWDHAQGSMTLNKELRLDNNKGLFFQNAAANATLGIKADTSDNITFRQNGSWDRLVIKSTGIDVSGNIVVTGTVDGVDIATRDAILTSTTTTAGAALPKAGGTMTGTLTVTGANTHLDGRNSAGLTLDLSGTGHYIIKESTTNDIIKFGGTGTSNFIAHNISSGNVGIGTDDPGTSKLKVYNSTVSGNTRLHIHNDKNSDAAELRLEGKRTSSNDTGQLLYVNSGNVVARIDAVSAGDDGELRFFTSVTGTGDNIVERMAISQEGDVRIQGGQLALSNLSSNPSSPISGAMYFNTTSDLAFIYNGTAWDQISNVPFGATGGTETTYSSDGRNYKVHTFTTSGTFTPISSGNVDVLVVAGGGGGGNCNTSEQGGGGGGAGGFITSSGTSGANTSAISQINVQPQAYTVTVGAGGAAGSFAEDQPGSQGANSIFSTVTAIGGGGGGGNSTEGTTGGSGGGGKESDGVGRSGTTGQGFAGGAGSETDDRGGGGGGASQAGQDYNASARSDGGDGLANSLRTGSAINYAGGGAGGGTRLGVASGGAGGGGNAGAAGSANTGGGGGSDTGSTSGTAAKAGGSGIVVIRYQI